MRADNIEIGTSGWRFDDWAGVFYPLRVPKSRWLEYYAARFRVVELNSSYYRLPSKSTIDALQRKTPEHFRVFIKLHGDVTHSRSNPQDSCAALLAAVEPLIQSGKLLGLLAQFPAAFKRTTENFEYLLRIRDWTKGVRLCVEFRDRSWDSEEVRRVFRSENLTWVCPDEPQIGNLIAPALHSTSDMLYVRLHGRNAATWYDKDAGDRYDYNYAEQEMSAWGRRLLDYSEELPGGYLFFNNCHLGQAVKNATWLFYWLQERRESAAGVSNDFTLFPPEN